MRLIDADALESKVYVGGPFTGLLESSELDAAPTVRCGECEACSVCEIHNMAILDVPNFGCAYFERRES